jgi:hypothetical protein
VRLPRSFRPSRREPGDFWDWFIRSEPAIQSIRTGGEPIAFQLTEQLRAEHPSLQWELSVSEAGDREFIVSAGGVRDVIPAVEALMATAPEIPGWKFIAFRQRKDSGQIQMGGQAFSMSDVWFLAKAHREHVDLDLYVKGFDGKDEVPYHIAFLALDVTLGEYDVMTKIGNIDFHALPDDPASQGLTPVSELAAIVDQL